MYCSDTRKCILQLIHPSSWHCALQSMPALSCRRWPGCYQDFCMVTSLGCIVPFMCKSPHSLWLFSCIQHAPACSSAWHCCVPLWHCCVPAWHYCLHAQVCWTIQHCCMSSCPCLLCCMALLYPSMPMSVLQHGTAASQLLSHLLNLCEDRWRVSCETHEDRWRVSCETHSSIV